VLLRREKTRARAEAAVAEAWERAEPGWLKDSIGALIGK
jgi:hypothetical protein